MWGENGWFGCRVVRKEICGCGGGKARNLFGRRGFLVERLRKSRVILME